MHAGDYGEDNITRCQPGEISWNIRRYTCNVKDESRRFILGLQLLLLRQLPALSRTTLLATRAHPEHLTAGQQL